MFKVTGHRSQVTGQKLKGYLLTFGFAFCVFVFAVNCPAQEIDNLEFTLDTAASTIPTPKIFKPNMDLSGRGFHQDVSWPQTVSTKEALDTWKKDIGFTGLYRIQYNFWEISQLAKNPQAKAKLLNNFEFIIKTISDAGGTVIIDIFGTPAGLGKVLDKKSQPQDLLAFKGLIKEMMRSLSCDKKYNIWYEAWNAPDLDEFFLGKTQEYLNLYRAIAEAAKELTAETKIHIPIGGPSVSWWFHNVDSNTIASPEKSLIYELIKFCYRYRLPLDFISCHAYSTDPLAEKEKTIYNKTPVSLIRDWLRYFDFDIDTPVLVDEWNYDRDANVLPERKARSFVCASYIPSRIKNMYEAGINNQTYFSLEDFQDNKEGLVRNSGVFYYDSEKPEYRGGAKATYNVFKILAALGSQMFNQKIEDEFVGLIATKSEGNISILIYNYIDVDAARNYLSRNIATLSPAERRMLVRVIKEDRLNKIVSSDTDVSHLRVTNKIKALIRKAQELNVKKEKFASTARDITITIKNLQDNYLYQRYTIDSSCALNCDFLPGEQKEINIDSDYKENLSLTPYSVQLISLKVKPKEPDTTNAVLSGTTPAVTAEPVTEE